MSLADFKQQAPKAYVIGQKGQTTAYELVQVQEYVTQDDMERQNIIVGFGSPRARFRKQKL